MGRLDGRVALITGGGRGIGRSIALAYAREGCSVAVSSRTQKEIDRVADEVRALGPRALAVAADVMRLADIKSCVSRTLSELGQLDILVNNAGGVVIPHDPRDLMAVRHGDQAFIENLTLNLVSAQRATQEALPHMLERKYGRIIHIGSGYAKRSGGPLSYTAAKHGLIGLARALAAEVAEHGITVNCLCPGWVETQLVDWKALALQWGTDEAGARAKAARENLQNRVGLPDEMGPMAVLLASEEAHNITGQVLSVDGGYRV